MKLILQSKADGRLLAVDEFEISQTLPKVMVAFWNGVDFESSHLLSIDRARALILEHIGESSFYLGLVSNGEKYLRKSVLRPLAMQVEGFWTDTIFHCTNIVLDNEVYSDLPNSAVRDRPLRSDDTASRIAKGLLSKGVSFSKRVSFLSPDKIISEADLPEDPEGGPPETPKESATINVWTTKLRGGDRHFVDEFLRYLPAMGLSLLTGGGSSIGKFAQIAQGVGTYCAKGVVLSFVGTAFVGSSVIAFITFLGAMVGSWGRSHFKNHSYKEYENKTLRELSSVTHAQRNAFSQGFNAGKCYIQYFHSYMALSAYFHPKAYYAGEVAGEKGNQILMNKVKVHRSATS